MATDKLSISIFKMYASTCVIPFQKIVTYNCLV